MALQEIDPTWGLHARASARSPFGGRIKRRARPRNGARFVVIGPDQAKRRAPTAPSRRLPLARMGRASFLYLTASWLGAVLALLAIALAIRWLS